jgi:pimeloyl-ACP methyl ester carboxylesterase
MRPKRKSNRKRLNTLMPAKLLVMGIALAAVILAQTDQPYSDVPYVGTPAKVVEAMLDIANIKAADVLVDLGSGDGRIVIAAAKKFGIKSIGVEIEPDLVRKSEQLAREEGVAANTRFVQSDIFEYDLRAASVVMVYLTPGVNLRLRSKLLAELKPGTRVISHRFDMGSWVPTRKITVEDEEIYLWVVPKTGAVPMTTPSESPTGAVSIFAYDSAAALNFHTGEVQTAPGATVTAVSFDGARAPVSGKLVMPSAKGRHPAIVFVHDYGNSDEFLPEALALARATPPAISLLIDAPPQRPVGWRRTFNAMLGNDNDRDIHIQAVIDIRRGIDVLAKRGDVDLDRIFYVGHGYGANWGAILSSIEPRLHGFVLVAGFPSLAELMASDDPDWANMRYALGRERFAAYQSSISAVDPIGYTHFWMGAPILFQFGRFDPFVSRDMADRLTNSISHPQKVEFYDAGHSVNDPRAAVERARFLAHCFTTRHGINAAAQ